MITSRNGGGGAGEGKGIDCADNQVGRQNRRNRHHKYQHQQQQFVHHNCHDNHRLHLYRKKTIPVKAVLCVAAIGIMQVCILAPRSIDNHHFHVLPWRSRLCEGVGGAIRFFIPEGTSYVDYIRRYLTTRNDFVWVPRSENQTVDYYDHNGSNRKLNIGRIANRMFDKTHLCQKHRLAHWLRNYQGEIIPPTAVIKKGVWAQVPRGFFSNSDTQRSLYFLKNSHRDNGKGVRVMEGLEKAVKNIDNMKTYVLQRHIPDMLLWENKFKFDLRMFSIATFEPNCRAKFYLYPIGYCRINPNEWENKAKKMLQVTNVSYFKRQNSSYNLVPTTNFSDFHRVWERLKHAVTVAYAETEDRMHPLENEDNSKNGYMLFAFDFMVDKDYHPWLLEVNASPGCSRNRRPKPMVDMLQHMFDQMTKLAVIPTLKPGAQPEHGDWVELDTSSVKSRSQNEK
mmetsp:Transcript_14557/g.35496  ORF Transcript_14557/g.35496 Transcript_14557/m.35496 type:complete len:452 (+) Transcript_14557:218-1573(+)